MPLRLTLVSHAATSALRAARFHADEPLDDRDGVVGNGTARASSLSSCGPELRTRQTADLLGLDAGVDEALRDCDYGRWTGSTLADLERDEPDAVLEWLRDPAAAPHGGESVLDLLERARRWLDDQAKLSSDRSIAHLVAVTHPAIIRAMVVVAIEATPDTFWRIDVSPLSCTVVQANGNRWNLRELGRSAP